MDTSYLFQVGGALSIALIGLIALVFILKKFDLKPTHSGAHIRVVSSKNIGPRERLMLIEVGEKQILIGATPQSIQPIHLLESSIQREEKESLDQPNFTQILRQIRGRQKQ